MNQSPFPRQTLLHSMPLEEARATRPKSHPLLATSTASMKIFRFLNPAIIIMLLTCCNAEAPNRPSTHMSAKRQNVPCLAMVLSPAELWGARVASAVTTYFGFVAVTDRPRGQLTVDPTYLEAKQSTVPGAGLGLFVTTTLRRGTVLGTYPGVVVPLPQNVNKLRAYPQCEWYTWRFSDNQFVIDPTNPQGEIQDFCKGGNLGMPLSVALFQTLLRFVQVPTTLCRINEPPKGRDVNVVTDEDLQARTVTFTLERDVYEGEELFIDYGLSYDRSRYGA